MRRAPSTEFAAPVRPTAGRGSNASDVDVYVAYWTASGAGRPALTLSTERLPSESLRISASGNG
jgi:hypothetical protein